MDPDQHFSLMWIPILIANPDFYLMRMRIQVTKMMRIYADPDPDADLDPDPDATLVSNFF